MANNLKVNVIKTWTTASNTPCILYEYEGKIRPALVPMQRREDVPPIQVGDTAILAPGGLFNTEWPAVVGLEQPTDSAPEQQLGPTEHALAVLPCHVLGIRLGELTRWFIGFEAS